MNNDDEVEVSENKINRVKQYIDTDVYTEAKNRIRHIINTFDKLYVCFSGGKDSLATLHLTQEVYDEMGITEKVNVIFRDEELIPDDVINFVQSYYKSGKYNFYYYAVPLSSSKFVLGVTYPYIQWDESRPWIREKPEFAIKDSGGKVFDQYTMDKFAVEGVKGKIAFLNGIRADESLVRLRSCLNKHNENYITATEIPNVKMCKPIYDWTQNDIFRYFYDKNIKYCGIYDLQVLNGDGLRVSTPLHAESAKRFDKIKTLYPTFYQQLVDTFPEMLVQARYWKELDRESIIYKYEHSFSGIIKYIKDTVDDPKMQKLAITRVLRCKTTRDNNMKAGKYLKTMGGYPILYVFKAILAGQYKRAIQPSGVMSPAMREYEGLK